MKCVIAKDNGVVSISQLTPTGVVAYEVVLDGWTDEQSLLEIADNYGWQPLPFDDTDGNLIYIEPIPLAVRFVGDELPENAIDLVRQTGVDDALAVLRSEPVEEGGAIRAYISLSKPFDWEWGEPTDFAE